MRCRKKVSDALSVRSYQRETIMWLNELWQRWLNRPVTGRRACPAPRRHGARLTLEQPLARTVPSSSRAARVSHLIAAINAATVTGGANTITLVAGNTSTLTAQNNFTDGGNGLPVVAANDNLSIVGNGDTIE